MCAVLLSVNVTLFLHISTKSFSNILCYIYLGLDTHFEESFLILIVFHIHHCSLICTTLFHFFSPFFSASSILFCVLIIHDTFFSFNPNLKVKLQVFIMNHIYNYKDPQCLVDTQITFLF